MAQGTVHIGALSTSFLVLPPPASPSPASQMFTTCSLYSRTPSFLPPPLQLYQETLPVQWPTVWFSRDWVQTRIISSRSGEVVTQHLVTAFFLQTSSSRKHSRPYTAIQWYSSRLSSVSLLSSQLHPSIPFHDPSHSPHYWVFMFLFLGIHSSYFCATFRSCDSSAQNPPSSLAKSSSGP